MSGDGKFGHWTRDEWGLPAYRYECDFRTDPAAAYDTITQGESRLHWHKAGNDRLWIQATNEGWLRVYEASRGRRWWHDRAGYAEIEGIPSCDNAAATWGTGYVRYVTNLLGLQVDRLTLAPFGDNPFIVCRIRVTATDAADHDVRWMERWPLRPIWLSGIANDDERRRAAGALRYKRTSTDWLTHVVESWSDEAPALAAGDWPLVPAPGAETWLAWLGGHDHMLDFSWASGERALSSQFRLGVPDGRDLELWLVAGFGPAPKLEDFDLAAIVDNHFAAWRNERCAASIEGIDDLSRETTWSAAAVRQACLADDVAGHTFIDQGGCYADPVGASNCRDTAQHALPMVYVAPELAAESLCHSLSTSDDTGNIDYAYLGAGLRHKLLWDPSDYDLWLLWLAAEYVAATGDLAILDREVGCWPSQAAIDMWPARFGRTKPGTIMTVREHLRMHLDHLIDEIGTGSHGLVRIRNADWNDSITMDTGNTEAMAEAGESVLNTAMARWVLPRYAAMCRRDAKLGRGDQGSAADAEHLVETAARADTFAADLVEPLEKAFVATHYLRARRPDNGPVGLDHPYLEPQPWAILSGDASAYAAKILDTVDTQLRMNSPLGARLHGYAESTMWGSSGEATSGGIWPAQSVMLVWAAARERPRLAVDELKRMTLANHADTYPDLWFGIWGGPDSWNAPESDRPGETWFEKASQLSAQANPVANTHVHSDVLLATLRIFGVAPGADGILEIDPTPAANGGRLRWPRLDIDVDERGRMNGRIKCLGPVQVRVRGKLQDFEPGWNML